MHLLHLQSFSIRNLCLLLGFFKPTKEALGYRGDPTLLLLTSLNESDFFEVLDAEDAEVSGVGKSADQRRAVIVDRCTRENYKLLKWKVTSYRS